MSTSISDLPYIPPFTPTRYINVPMAEAERSAYISNYISKNRMWSSRFSARKFEMLRPFRHFLSLPAEVRNIIYELLLVAQDDIEQPFGPHRGQNRAVSRRTIHAALFYVNHQVSAEALSVFYRKNEWVISDPMDIYASLDTQKMPVLNRVNNMEFVFEPNPFGTARAGQQNEILPDRYGDWTNYMFSDDEDLSPLFRFTHLERVTFDFSAVPYDTYSGKFPPGLLDLILSWLNRQQNLQKIHIRGLENNILEQYKLTLCVEPETAMKLKEKWRGEGINIDALLMQQNP